MIALASGLGMRVGSVSRQLRGVGVIAMPDSGLDTMQCPEVHPGAGVLRLPVPGAVGGVFIDRPCEADGVELTR